MMSGRINGAFIKDVYCQDRNPNRVKDFNDNYQVRVNTRLPDYEPYPTLHPFDHTKEQQNGDPHHGAGWGQPKRAPYLTPEQQSPPPSSSPSAPPACQSAISDCEELIKQVLTNQYCRRVLKNILTEEPPKLTDPPVKDSSIDNDGIKNIIIYSIGGLFLLTLINIAFKLGQLLRK